MTEIIQKTTKDNSFKKIKKLNAQILEEQRRIMELDKLLESNSEIYQLASYSRRNVSEDYVSNKGAVRQIDAKLEDAQGYLKEIHESLANAISNLMTLNTERLKVDLYISKLSDPEKKLLTDFIQERPVKELERELNLSERTIKRKKQEMALRLENLLYSDASVKELL